MSDPVSEQDGPLRRLIHACRCQFCRNRLSGERVRITAHYDDVWLLGVRCTRCRRSQAFWVTTPIDSAVPPSDLSPAERRAAEERPPISIDDLLDVHRFLAEFDGNFRVLFSGRP